MLTKIHHQPQLCATSQTHPPCFPTTVESSTTSPAQITRSAPTGHCLHFHPHARTPDSHKHIATATLSPINIFRFAAERDSNGSPRHHCLQTEERFHISAETTERSPLRDSNSLTYTAPPYVPHNLAGAQRSMEDSLAEERVLRQHADALLKDQSQPIGRVTGIFEQYRALWLANTIAHFDLAERRQSQLWDLHQAGRRYFRDALVPMRKEGAGKAVVARQLASIYRQWIKDAVAFYRAYIYRLNSAFGGIPELQTVAHEMKQEVGESSQASLTPEVRNLVLNCCHQTLIHLGDLSRYRASEQLDKRPDFGPALGFYGLANTLRPSSGLGFHQQAVVQLELKDHLKAVYYLYRAAVVHDPHPLAAKNLQLEFGKVNAAWEKGQLIPKTGPADPEAPRHILIGWFVRMHSMCAKGDVFRSHEELESELISQLSAAVKKEGVMAETTLRRMTMTNLAAQYHSGLLFQGMSEPGHATAITDRDHSKPRDAPSAGFSVFLALEH